MQQYVFIVIIAIVFLAMIIFAVLGKNYSLDKIKARKVGNGQHGTAHWAEHKEISQNFSILKYEPQLWRMGACRPTIDGTIVGFEKKGKDTYALIDTSDVHTLMIAAAGTGKTTFFLEPNIEYCCAAGMSFISTDTKGDIYRNCGYVAAKRYGYKISVIDLRNPLKSDGFNLLHLVKKYMDEHKNNPLNISAKAKSERYAKIVADSIIAADGDKYGANTYFYDAAKGLIAALILIIAEYGNDKECHIVSVLKLMIELLEAKPQKKSQLKSETYFADLIKLLPPEHKARWLSGAAINNADQAALSVISTALSRLNSLIDTETEQILCFNTAIDTETLCKEKCAVFIVLPEEDRTKYVIANLIIEQISREIYHIADENGGHLDKRIMIYFEEFGTMPPISGVEAMFSALRSRSVSIVAIIQSFAQLEKNYGKQGSEIIVDNTQLMLFGGFAPGSSSAEKLSKDLGKQTILTGSISKGNGGKNSGHQSQQLQMTGRELITADELKCLPKGTFICTKTGMSPFKVQLLFYEKLGILYDEKLNAEIKEVKTVYYADRKSISKVIKKQHIDEQENEMNKEENVSDINELITDYSLEEDDIFTETPSSKKMIRT